MARVRVPWTSQPPLGTALDPYWVKRGLQLVYDGRRVVYSRGSGSLQTATFTGGPKAKPSLKGIVTGFGTTSGTGTTDRIDSGILDAPKSGMRSVVAHVFAKGTGGGTLGRVFQSTSGSGAANAGDEGVWFAAGGMSVSRATSTLAGTQYSTTSAFPLGRWAVFGSSFMGDYPTNTAAMLFVDGVSVAVTANSVAGAAFTAGTSMNVAFGNRADGTRGFDGQIGPVLIFDGYLTQQEHARLAANPWQVFQPLARNIYSDVLTSGVSGTLAKTNANDSVSASGATTVIGSLAKTNANDSAAASGSIGSSVSGTVAATNAADTSAAAGTTTVAGSLSKSNANDSATASGTTTVTGSTARTNADDPVVASGVTGSITGAVSVTNANDYGYAAGSSGAQQSYTNEVVIKPWYIRRNKKILLFSTAQEADAFLEAEEQAEQAIQSAQKTSRRARKRLRDKIITVEPIQTVDVDQLAQAVERFSIPVDLPKLIAQQDYDQVMKILALASDMADEEDIEMLLLM